MAEIDLDDMTREILTARTSARVGRIASISAGMAQVSGVCDVARVGDRVSIAGVGAPTGGEICDISETHISVLPDRVDRSLALGARVALEGEDVIFPSTRWKGRVISPLGMALDGKPLARGQAPYALNGTTPATTHRKSLGERLETGMTIFNTLLPIVRGQRVGLFAGSGVGKSTLIAQFCARLQADVIVLVLIGERSREVGDFVNNILGTQGMARTVVIAATSDQPASLRKRSALFAMSVAEYFRDQGQHVVLLADSITRFAEAHREIATARGEHSSSDGFPASTLPQITALCERAGPGLQGSQGDITAVLSVFVTGSDMEGPIADMIRGTLDGHVVLDRKLAERGQFPAVSVTRSVSRALPEAASNSDNELISRARQIMSVYQDAEVMVQAGLYERGNDPELDVAVTLWSDICAFLTGRDGKRIPEHFEALAQLLNSGVAGEQS